MHPDPFSRQGFCNVRSAAPTGRIIFGSVPGVKTPGLVLMSLRDKKTVPSVPTGRPRKRGALHRLLAGGKFLKLAA